MCIELAKDVWDEMKQWVNTIDQESAAEGFVSILVDHDYDVSEIKQTFKSDRAIKTAIKSYEKEEHWHEEHDEDDEDY